MTNQEIIEQLKSLKSHCEAFKNEEDCVWSKDVEALDRAIEALEKQELKKPSQDSLDGIHYFPTCPNCKQDLEEYEHQCKCGQAIDWSDTDD